jgi:glycosyltransferase involved in cell wall biosynthesis
LPELVRDGETGWLTAPGDSAALAEALRNMIVSRERARELGISARNFVLHQHSAELHYDRLMSTFSELQDAEGRGRERQWTYR